MMSASEVSGIEMLRQIVRSVDAVAELSFDGLPRDERLAMAREIGVARTKLESLRSALLFVMQDKGDHELTGARNLLELEVETSREPAPEVRKTIARGETLSTLPLFDAALRAAEISPAHVDLLRIQIREPALKEQLADGQYGEGYVLGLAKRFPADVFKRKLKGWAIRFAPKKAEREHQQALREETLTIKEDDGGWAIRGWLSTLSGSALNTVLNTMMFSSRPQLGIDRTAAGELPSAGGGLGSGGEPVLGNKPAVSEVGGSFNARGESDGETQRLIPTQLRAHALAALARYLLDHGLLEPESRVRPHISVHVPAATLEGYELSASQARMCEEVVGQVAFLDEPLGEGCDEVDRVGSCRSRDVKLRERIGARIATIRAGFDEDLLTGLEPAYTDDGIPISPTELATVLCGSELRRIVLSSDSEVLDVGRQHRIATAAQTRAVIARDRTCRYPGCHRPPSDGQVHHSFEWEHGGKTDIDNLVLLCWHHHQYIHAHSIDIHHHTGGFLFKKGLDVVGVSLAGNADEVWAA